MTPGREPTLLTCQALMLAITFLPTFSRGAEAQKEPSNSWAPGSTESPAKIPADPSDSPEPPPQPSYGSPPPTSAWTPPSAEQQAAQQPGVDAWPTDPRANDWSAAEEDEEPWGEQDTQAHRHAPRYSFWLGPALAWSVPFGDLWGHCGGFDAYGRCAAIANVPVSDFFGSGPAFELDAGARLGKHYNLFALWERTWFSNGNQADSSGVRQTRGDSDFVALGLRVTTDPDNVGFVLDVAVGTRRMRARWEDGSELQLTDAPFETRLGIGANIRLDENWSFTPLLHLGLGSFGKMEWLLPDKTIQPASGPGDVALTHGWVGLQVSAHADIFGSKD
jgi:hypothetical protein